MQPQLFLQATVCSLAIQGWEGCRSPASVAETSQILLFNKLALLCIWTHAQDQHPLIFLFLPLSWLLGGISYSWRWSCSKIFLQGTSPMLLLKLPHSRLQQQWSFFMKRKMPRWSPHLINFFHNLFVLILNLKCQLYHLWGILHTGINISIVATIRNIGPHFSSIIKGFVNYFVPIFAPASESRKGNMITFHQILSIITNLSICAVIIYFTKKKETLGFSLVISIAISVTSLVLSAGCWGCTKTIEAYLENALQNRGGTATQQ